MTKPYRSRKVGQSAPVEPTLIGIDASSGTPVTDADNFLSVAPTTRKPRVKASKPEVRGVLVAVCQCGCNETFNLYRKDQLFKSGHRRKMYVSHRCPDCGVVHLVGVKKK